MHLLFNLALPLPEIKFEVKNLSILSCFSLKLWPELNDLSLALSLFLNKIKSSISSKTPSENFHANNVRRSAGNLLVKTEINNNP